MFGKRCSKCDSKVKDGYSFCPSCGDNLRGKYEQEDYGLLGKDDSTFEEKMSFSDSFMEKMFNSALKVLEKQMKNLNNEINNPKNRKHNPGLNVQFFVNGERVFSDNEKREEPIVIKNNFSKDKLKLLSSLPRKEPESNIKRLADKVIYELKVPGVNSVEDVFINQLENSLEIKALSKDTVYSKNLKVNLPILRYQLNNDNLLIEMQGR